MSVELVLVVVAYFVATGAVLLGMVRLARKKRRKQWQAYYRDPSDRSRPSRSKPRIPTQQGLETSEPLDRHRR